MQTPERPMTLVEKIMAIQNLMVIVSLSVIIFTRKNVGYRLLNPLHLCGLAVFLFFVGGLSINTPNHELLILLSGLILLFGFGQRLRRWIDFKRGIYQHSYYLGDSLWECSWFPKFILRKRLLSRFVDPLFCVIIGFALMDYCGPLGGWIAFSGFALWHVEAIAAKRNQDQNMDVIDSMIAAGLHARSVEEYSAGPKPAPHKTGAIPTGLASDIQHKIREA